MCKSTGSQFQLVLDNCLTAPSSFHYSAFVRVCFLPALCFCFQRCVKLEMTEIFLHCWRIRISTAWFSNCNSILFPASGLSFTFYFRIMLYPLWCFLSNTLKLPLDPVHQSWLELFRFNGFQLNAFFTETCPSLNLNLLQIYGFAGDKT